MNSFNKLSLVFLVSMVGAPAMEMNAMEIPAKWSFTDAIKSYLQKEKQHISEKEPEYQESLKNKNRSGKWLLGSICAAALSFGSLHATMHLPGDWHNLSPKRMCFASMFALSTLASLVSAAVNGIKLFGYCCENNYHEEALSTLRENATLTEKALALFDEKKAELKLENMNQEETLKALLEKQSEVSTQTIHVKYDEQGNIVFDRRSDYQKARPALEKLITICEGNQPPAITNQ